MSTLERAIEIAARAHAGVLDKTGQPYILHPIRVMVNVTEPTAKIVAVLHDVVEDTDITLEDIAAAGFSKEVIEALDLVTHKSDQSYAEYVIACKPNKIASRVKLMDLMDNSNPERLAVRPKQFSRDMARVMRYALSYQFLTSELTEKQYRELMRQFEEESNPSSKR